MGVFALIVGGASAQEPVFSPAATEKCLAAAVGESEREACVGLSAHACMDAPGGYSTVGMGACLDGEYRFWDGRLNAAYQRLMALEVEAAAELRELGSAAPSPADALRDVQRAWIAFRDASCLYEVSQWGGGTGGGPAGAECMMQMAARQALALEDRLATREGR